MVRVLLHIFLQIVLESLPVSSSGNVKLLPEVFSFFYTIEPLASLPPGFDFFLHGPTILIVGLFFFKTWWRYLKGFFTFEHESVRIVAFCIVVDIITAAWYVFFLYSEIQFLPLWVGFLITSLALLSLRFCSVKNNKVITMRQAFILGVVQGVTLLPGLSRFALTFCAGRWLGIARMRAFELSFLIAWPLMLAGFVKGSWQLYQFDGAYQVLNWPVLCSIIIATGLAYCALRWVATVIARGSMWKFFCYPVLLSIIALMV